MKRSSSLPDRGIDHLVLAVRDLEAAVAVYRALGFTVTPRAHHPWGTSNQLVQLDQCFLEVIEVAKPEKLVKPSDRMFSFGYYLDRYLTKREGLAMLVFESQNAQEDRDLFADRGLPDLDRFDFERQAVSPDGGSVRVAFSLAFTPLAEAPDAVFFTCQQHSPEYFWKPEYQSHANGAQSIAEIAMIADDPNVMRSSLEKIHSQEAVYSIEGGIACDTVRGQVRVLTPVAYEEWYGEPVPPNAPPGPHFAATRITVANLEGTMAQLKAAGFKTHWARAGLIVSSTAVFGCAIAFAQG